MKKIMVSFAVIFTLSTAFVSCRETKETKIEIEADDAADDIEDAVDDAVDAVEEGVDEVQENTGTGGTDDN